MIAVIYYDEKKERQLLEGYAETLRNNGIPVVPIPSEGLSVACPGCEYAPDCEEWDVEGWCVKKSDDEYYKYTEGKFTQGKYVDGHFYIEFKEHPHSGEDGYVQCSRLLVELVANKLAEQGSQVSGVNFYWDDRVKGYLLRPESKVIFLDGDENNLDINNLDVESEYKKDADEVWVLHPGTGALQ